MPHRSTKKQSSTNEIEQTIRRLLEANALREPLLQSIIQVLRLTPGSQGLDAGCGIGLQTLLLSRPPQARIGQIFNACASQGHQSLSWIAQMIMPFSLILCF
jgi:hypothetical protein